jgi:hypothetical protein
MTMPAWQRVRVYVQVRVRAEGKSGRRLVPRGKRARETMRGMPAEKAQREEANAIPPAAAERISKHAVIPL